jgi:hypothetical protein
MTIAQLQGSNDMAMMEVPLQAPVQGASETAATATVRDKVFDRLSHLFRGAGSDVTTQALFRAVMEYRVEQENSEEGKTE